MVVIELPWCDKQFKTDSLFEIDQQLSRIPILLELQVPDAAFLVEVLAGYHRNLLGRGDAADLLPGCRPPACPASDGGAARRLDCGRLFVSVTAHALRIQSIAGGACASAVDELADGCGRAGLVPWDDEHLRCSPVVA